MFWGPSKSGAPVPMAPMAPIDKLPMLTASLNQCAYRALNSLPCSLSDFGNMIQNMMLCVPSNVNEF